ncbi:MAG: ABC transporter permease, partial [Planctomycetota bacterium]
EADGLTDEVPGPTDVEIPADNADGGEPQTQTQPGDGDSDIGDTDEQPQTMPTESDEGEDLPSPFAPDADAGYTIDAELKSALFLFTLVTQVFCILLSLMYGGTIIGTTSDRHALAYLFVRPIARWKIVAGRWAGIVAVITAVLWASLAGCWALLGTPGGSQLLLALLLSTLLSAMAFVGVFAVFGVMLARAAVPMALVYGLFYEVLLSWMPALLRKYSVSFYTRSVAFNLGGVPVPQQASELAGAELALGLVMPVLIALACVFIAGRAARSIQLEAADAPEI